MEIFKDFTFEAAHRLPNIPEGHKCARLHGHSFRVRIYVGGAVSENSGWIIDFADIKEIVQPVIDELDHQCLNDITRLENPTSENIAIWIWRKIEKSLPGLCRIIVQENCTSGCVYSGKAGGK